MGQESKIQEPSQKRNLKITKLVDKYFDRAFGILKFKKMKIFDMGHFKNETRR